MTMVGRYPALALVLTLAACGGDATSVPPSCPQGEFLAAMNSYVDAAALDAGGVACSYGIQEAEVGATVLWSTAEAFVARRAQWQADGQVQVEVNGADEAWALQETNDNETHLWALNLLVDDVWIQIGATFLPDLKSAGPLIDAALNETRR
ncbi:MAG: hypothetical protein RLZZ43_576 [Actinomycetota bacterium]